MYLEIMRYLIQLILLLTVIIASIRVDTAAQTFITNKIEIDKKRYDPITGSPYYFDAHQQGELFLTAEEEPFDVSFNINLQEGDIELFIDDMYAVLDSKRFDHIKINDSARVLYSQNKIIVELYNSGRFKLMDYPRISIRESTHRPPGEVIIKKKFDKKNNYQIFIDGVPKSIDIKKKSIIKALGKEAEQLAKKSKNKLKNVTDLVELLDGLKE